MESARTFQNRMIDADRMSQDDTEAYTLLQDIADEQGVRNRILLQAIANRFRELAKASFRHENDIPERPRGAS